MNYHLANCFAVVMLPLLVACAAPSNSRMFGPVGPQPVTSAELSPKGYLKVYTATEDHDDGDLHYFPHTGYTIYSEDGERVVQKVANAIGIHDQCPSLVQLPVGKYVVRAEAERNGMVRIAVLIKPGLLTVVDLEYDAKQNIHHSNISDLVQLPNGQIVGWRATASPLQGP